MRSIFILLVSVFSIHNIHPKPNPTSIFDSVYYKTTVKLSGMKPNNALVIVDSLYHYSETGLQKISSLMLSANIYQWKNDQVLSIQDARQAYDYAMKENNYSWQAHICCFLSKQYRNIGLFEEGREYIKKSLEVNRKVASSIEQKMQIALIEQELAYYGLLDNDYKVVLKHVSNSTKILDETVQSPNYLFYKASAEYLRGRAFLGLKLYKQAEKTFLKSLHFLNSFECAEGVLSGYIYLGLGDVFVETKNDSLALSYFKLAEIRAKSSENLNLELALYKQTTALYKRIEAWESYNIYSSRFDSLISIDKNLKRLAIQDAFYRSKQEHKKSIIISRIYLGGGIALALSLLFFVLLYRCKENGEFKRFKILIDNFKCKKQRRDIRKGQGCNNNSSKNRVFSLEIELNTIENLKRFEEELEFLNPSTSLSSLADFCDVNTRNLSHILNNYIRKDFSSYINELRVNYGIKILKNDPAFRNYKISYLADFLGFSSHSKFTAVFKDITGLSPSVFIEFLNEKKI